MIINTFNQRVFSISLIDPQSLSLLMSPWEQLLFEHDAIWVMSLNESLEPGTCDRLVGSAVALKDLVSGLEGLGGFDDHISVLSGGRVDGLGVAIGRVIGELCSVSEVEKELVFLHEQSASECVLQLLVTHRLHLLPAQCHIMPHNMPKNGKWILRLKNPKDCLGRDVLEGEDSLSFHLTIPHLKLVNKRHPNCFNIIEVEQQSQIQHKQRKASSCYDDKELASIFSCFEPIQSFNKNKK